jgi:predicted transcriptional regulator
MVERRVDRIVEYLKGHNNRARLQDVLSHLRQIENYPGLSYSSIYIAIQFENQRMLELGERPQFITSKDGEVRGWVRLRETSEFAKGSPAQKIERLIREQNDRVGEDLRNWLQQMDWRTFESTFLTQVLQSLGFQDVEITQPTRDGGADARVTYRRGIVDARAVVSAKRWTRQSVGLDEVQRLRGLKGEEDTAIIVTTGRFSSDAQAEARPGQNQRVVYLIDGDKLVEICKRHAIGVKSVTLNPVLILDPETRNGSAQELEKLAPDEEDDSPEGEAGIVRLRNDMLGDAERGLSVDEIAQLSGYAIGTVRNNLSTGRESSLREAIRDNKDTLAKALQIITQKRARAVLEDSSRQEASDSPDGGADDSPNGELGVVRLRNDMLGDAERGLSVDEVAQLSGYTVGTVRNYLSTDRESSLREAIRDNKDALAKALQIISKKRASVE